MNKVYNWEITFAENIYYFKDTLHLIICQLHSASGEIQPSENLTYIDGQRPHERMWNVDIYEQYICYSRK